MKRYLFAMILISVAAVMLGLGIGAYIGRNQAENWSVIDKHIQLEAKGYTYCPYCGEMLKGE